MNLHNQIVLLFAITQLLGIFSGMVLIENAMKSQEIQNLSVSPLQDQNDPANAFYFIIYILFSAVLIILITRYYKGVLMFKLIEAAIVFSASSVVFFAFAMFPFGLGIVESIAVGIVVGMILAIAKMIWDEAKNIVAVTSSAGVGAIFGFSIGFLPAVIFIVLLSIYDYIAVFKTKHMIMMAKELSSRQLSFSVTAKSIPKRKEHESVKAYEERLEREGERLDLGTGDLAVPAMLAVSAYSIGENGMLYSLAIALGSTVALYFLLKFVSKRKVFLPALPPICLGGMLMFLMVKLAGF